MLEFLINCVEVLENVSLKKQIRILKKVESKSKHIQYKKIRHKENKKQTHKKIWIF